MTYLLALDQGTSSSRSVVFDGNGHIHALAQRELPQIFPKPGWVEHDPLEIWRTQLATAREALAKAGITAHDVRALGITNQRETTVVWNRDTGQPIHSAIVWQDRRSEAICAELRARGLTTVIQAKTGLLIDAYFSGSKLKWLLDNIPGARRQADNGELAFGTVDSWLIWQLTHGAVHATDVSNASRTMLFNVHSNQWDEELLNALDIPASLMPAVKPSSAVYGEVHPDLLGAAIPIGGVAGDQQSALFGQACFTPGMVKNTYGTGCFMLMHTGPSFHTSTNGLITSSAAQTASQAEFVMEGSVFVAGAVVQWLRDGLHAISSSSEAQALAETVPDSGGVIVVPAFTGLGAPYWKPDARGAMLGLSRGTTLGHIARASLESIAFQCTALLQAMRRDALQAGISAVTELRVDGGASVNNLLMQFQADLLGIPVVRPMVTETTALGAAYLAGLSTGVFKNTHELSAQWQVERRFEPRMAPHLAADLMERWEHAVRQTIL
ncbi:glycerol kinase GlpK [Rhodoferax sp.]|uniref:glycerol kinase GlpK n=1 Tax=Rhodoferax sp. TaxID=50421 RepID=UPI0028406E40|nr:glycerol kinase GlpK [Rhodoferax sp.]MDR3371668.1 glycerol kinase GlpK [Rhodoferax sp.]